MVHFLWVNPNNFDIIEYDKLKLTEYVSENVKKFELRAAKGVPFTPAYFNNYALNSDDFVEFLKTQYKRNFLERYRYLVAVPDDVSEIEKKILRKYLTEYRCRNVAFVSQGTLLSTEKRFISITQSVRGLCVSDVKDFKIAMQEYIPVNIICQDKLQVSIWLKRTVEMLQIDDVPIFCYINDSFFKIGTEVNFGEIMLNAVNYMVF